MRLAILTDIHANKEAFLAVLADVKERGVDQVVVLGDVVGYGPDPDWCVDRVVQLVKDGAICVKGNHDAAVTTPDPAMNPVAKAAIDWTAAQLSDDRKVFLSSLPLTNRMDDMLFVHASANDPGDWIYVTSENRAMGSFHTVTDRLVFCGHVHKPALYSCDIGNRVGGARIVPGSPVPLLKSRRWLAVVGAVGQPRDGIPQAAWALLDSDRNELTFRRVPYDIAATAARIRAAGLPDSLARRIMTGE